MGSVICVSVGRGRHRHLIAEYKHIAEQGAKLVELRLDFIQSAVNLKRILAEKPCPVVITCRRAKDGGLWKGSEEQRLLLLRTAIVEGVDYVDLEEDVAGSIPQAGPIEGVTAIESQVLNQLRRNAIRLIKLRPFFAIHHAMGMRLHFAEHLFDASQTGIERA